MTATTPPGADPRRGTDPQWGAGQRPVAEPRRGAPRRWASELALGVRLSVAGGRSGWVRLAMISLGVGLGVALLFVAATIPALVGARDARIVARAEQYDRSLSRGADTLLIAVADTQYRGRTIHGRLIQPEGDRAALPPGLARRLAPGEMVVSPALARLLDSDEGALLRGRWDARLVGTIGAAGLTGPGEYAFYLGTDRLTEGTANRMRAFGRSDVVDPGVPPILLLLGVVALIVLLLPVAVFVATAVRFGGESRDRQLAALRLVGADAAMTRRIAAGETLAGALLGLVVGGLLYLAVCLPANRFLPAGMSFYLADLRPVPALAALVVVGVPAGSVLVTMSALRRVVVEPLGVVRLSVGRRRRLWWRLVLPVVGLALLYPLHSALSGHHEINEYQVMGGVAALLVGVALLLPWLVEATVRRLGGGGVAWQLAVRRLQLDSGTAVRAVSGIAVSVAGAIALQGLLAAVQAQYALDTGRDTDRYQVKVATGEFQPAGGWAALLGKAPGVREVGSMAWLRATPTGADPATTETRLVVGDCAVLRQTAKIETCADGDTFVVAGQGAATPRPGSGYQLGEGDGSADGPGGGADPRGGTAPEWTLPTTARTVSAHAFEGPFVGEAMILATPAAVRGSLPGPLAADRYYIGLDPADPDALDRLRNAATRADPLVAMYPVGDRPLEGALRDVRQGLLVGAAALLLLVGASMLVNVAEQLRERRRLLAVLVAFGTRRNTLTGSVLYQVAIPVALGMTLAVATGTGLSTLLQAAAGAPIRFDWSGIGTTSGAAAGVVVATTAASLPLLWRLTRPGGLRSE